jgi:hypothetical protein
MPGMVLLVEEPNLEGPRGKETQAWSTISSSYGVGALWLS